MKFLTNEFSWMALAVVLFAILIVVVYADSRTDTQVQNPPAANYMDEFNKVESREEMQLFIDRNLKRDCKDNPLCIHTGDG